VVEVGAGVVEVGVGVVVCWADVLCPSYSFLQDNRGFKLIQLMGWSSGSGLGKYRQGQSVQVLPHYIHSV